MTTRSNNSIEAPNSAVLATLLQGIDASLRFPDRVLEPFAWVEHIPFARFIATQLRPKVFVELGVHTGNSYCSFLEGLTLAGVDCKAFGVDSWRGDEHAWDVDEAIYNRLAAYHYPKYGSFSTLLKMYFSEALPQFNAGEIDLLHIDGFHTYDAVNADFEQWLPKMSSRGIILFHDTAVRSNQFGVWKLWSELSKRYPHFEFYHGFGLGVLGVGSEIPEEIAWLFKEGEVQDKARALFARLGGNLHARLDESQRHSLMPSIEQRKAAFYADDAWFAELRTTSKDITPPLTWRAPIRLGETGIHLSLGIARPVPSLELTLCNAPCELTPRNIELLYSDNTVEVLTAETLFGGKLIDGQLWCDDPKGPSITITPQKDKILAEIKGSFCIASIGAGIYRNRWAGQQHQIDTLHTTLKVTTDERERMRASAALAEQHKAALDKILLERPAIERLQREVAQLTAQLDQRSNERQHLSQQLVEHKQILKGVLASSSWKLTEPLRKVVALVRGGGTRASN